MSSKEDKITQELINFHQELMASTDLIDSTQVASLNAHLLKEKVSRIGQNNLYEAVSKKFLIHQQIFISIILTRSPPAAGSGRIFPNAKGVKVVVTR